MDTVLLISTELSFPPSRESKGRRSLSSASLCSHVSLQSGQQRRWQRLFCAPNVSSPLFGGEVFQGIMSRWKSTLPNLFVTK